MALDYQTVTAVPVAPRMSALATTVSAILTIASRDLRKFLRDRPRIIGTLITPLLFIGAFGGSLQANLGAGAGYNLLTYTFTGVFAMTLFQSTVGGLTSLLEDRENDFTQELFIAPISRYAIVFGKIFGESLVALVQGVVTVAFGVLAFGVPLSAARLLPLLPVGIAVCLFGGAFGVFVLSLFSNQRSANQIIPFLIFPQFLLAGVFTPVRVLPWYLEFLSIISPLRYAVDLIRGVFYAGQPDAAKVVLASPFLNLAIMAAMFAVFLVIGTTVFVRAERNR